MQYVKVWLRCKCGNWFEAFCDAFGVYYCEVCEQYRQTDTED